jgi:acyl-ACP thioesterase
MNPEVLDKEAKYIRRFSVRTYESDHNGLLRPSSLLNFFQEAAAEHAEKLGAGVIALFKRNLTWVISRYHIRIFRYPLWKESLELMTWPVVHQGLFALREFEIRDEKGDISAAATSSWMLIDLKTQRPVPPAERLGSYLQDPRRAVVSSFETLPTVGRADLERSFRVRMSDLDWNRHVNHVAYIAWALETTSPDFLEKYRPAEIEVDFRGQAFYGETALCRMQSFSPGGEPTIVYQIIKGESQGELARLRVVWRA